MHSLTHLQLFFACALTVCLQAWKLVCILQVPMVPLTDIIRRLAADLYGLEVADAASVFGTPEAIISSCETAGFNSTQVPHISLCLFSHLRSVSRVHLSRVA